MTIGRFYVVKSGFTIVELLVVIVVIGIISSITLASYSNISQRATVASLQSDLNNAAKQLKLDQIVNNGFPSSLALANSGKGIASSPGTTYQYSVDNSTSPQSFCITAVKSGQSYKITESGIAAPGVCLDYGLIMRLDAGYAASYPGTGTTWTDLSGNGSNGTLVNGVAYNTLNGGVFSFDGVNDYVNIPYSAQYNIRNAITLCIWIKRTAAFNQTQDMMILGRPPAWYFYDSYNSGNIHGDVYIDGTRRAALDAGVPFDGSWYQVVYTYDSNTHAAYIYKNGSQVLAATLTGLSNYLIDESTASFASMGLHTLGRSSLLNDARIYNRALSSSEVGQIFNSTKSRYGL